MAALNLWISCHLCGIAKAGRRALVTLLGWTLLVCPAIADAHSNPQRFWPTQYQASEDAWRQLPWDAPEPSALPLSAPLPDSCATGMRRLSHYLQQQGISFSVEVAQLWQYWLVWGQFFNTTQQLEHMLHHLDQHASGAAFLHLSEQQFWLLNLEQCLIWLMAEPITPERWQIRFSLPLLPEKGAKNAVIASKKQSQRSLMQFFYQHLPVLHQYAEPDSGAYLTIYQWQPGVVSAWESQWKSLGIAIDQLRQCTVNRLCTLAYGPYLVTLVWSQNEGQDYLLVAEQPCEGCDVERKK